ncbi:hypothetical protein AVEN_200735-1 [Araneus ventricosus]|uniref:Uncharacterized protein n=1 Tax=Araneus ventricosus TaxID=182803 RepID=A0A4Y2INP7_ARAVE|nr:hypothetical protein AVEN_258486-1 [Araneus ventricosus]GBM79307.1 hypothetical protein AVEN_17079-1 [Araneus ventricosus]GBM79397.1 hypothetical protein AVEN_62899-1 [Araneus ventricosus]GBM79580.1 hypothetical protein AVEN_200735-1 [Araneus ventricosus]
MKADEDADCLIVNSTLALAPKHPSVVVIGEDIALLLILIGVFTFDNIYFLKPGKGKIPEKIFSPHTGLEKTIADNILFIHAMSGCDSTSALFNYGKMKFVQTLKNNPDLLKVIEIFKNPDITPEAVVDAGNRFLVALPLHLTLSCARYPASARRDARDIVAAERPNCFVQRCFFIVGTTAITGRCK